MTNKCHSIGTATKIPCWKCSGIMIRNENHIQKNDGTEYVCLQCKYKILCGDVHDCEIGENNFRHGDSKHYYKYLQDENGNYFEKRFKND